MHITLVDDSIPFDGFSPDNRPLGGPEKAFASLAGALVRRGHRVHVYNRARYPMVIEGAHWETLDKGFPTQTEALIAFRKPSLLGSVRLAAKRFLWLTAPAHQLEPTRKLIDSFAPVIIFQGPTQAKGWRHNGELTLRMIPPGLRGAYTSDAIAELAEPPTAIVTTHPSHGLSWLLDVWAAHIRRQVPNARLLIVSAVLAKGQNGLDIAEDMRPHLAKALATAGVEIIAPTGDPGMALLYRSARVHLYPGHPDDMVCWTLAESQACGLPAVARDLGAVRERIRDGQTGNVVPDDAAFANVAVRLLSDDDTFWGMNRDACLLQRERSWDVAAAEFDALLNGQA